MNFRLTPFLAAIALAIFAPTLLEAQATRTWISGVGDDANPCSRTAPCKTWAGAISKTATGGEINVLDPGGFGAVTITKSITLDGNGLGGSILGASTNGIIVNAGADATVRIRGFTLNGVGTGLAGIRVLAAGNVTIEDVVIDGFTNGITVEGAAQVVVRNSSIRNNSKSGIQAGGTAQVVISGNAILFNAVGLEVTGGSVVSYKNNVFHGNKKDGEPTSTKDLK